MPITTPADASVNVRSASLRLRPATRRTIGILGLIAAALCLALAATVPAVTGAFLVVTAGIAASYLPTLGVALLIVTAPLLMTVPASVSLIPLPVAAMIVLLLVITLIRQVIHGRRHLRPNAVDLAVVTFLLGSALSLFAPTQIQPSAMATAMLAGAVYFLARYGVTRPEHLSLIVVALATYGLAQTAGIAIAVFDGTLRVSEATRASGTLVDPNHLAGAIVLIIPVLLATGMARPERWVQAAAILATLALCVALAATLSRSGWLGLLAGGTILTSLLPEQRVRILLVGASVAAALVIAGLALPIGLRLAPHATGPWEMLASRERVWNAALTMVQDHPLSGVGIGNFGALYPAYGTRPLTAAHAHNLFLNIAAERGIPALSAFLLIVGTTFGIIFKAWPRMSTPRDRALLAGLAASLTAYLVHSIFEVSYLNATVLILFWLLVGSASGALGWSPEARSRQRHSRPRARNVLVPA